MLNYCDFLRNTAVYFQKEAYDKALKYGGYYFLNQSRKIINNKTELGKRREEIHQYESIYCCYCYIGNHKYDKHLYKLRYKCFSENSDIYAFNAFP